MRITGDTVETSISYRVRLLSSEALAAGNINLAWNPDTTKVTVHRLLVHRGDQTIDVLQTSRFNVFQREGRLEQAMLDGMLTANLQAPGLRVGDEIEFAATTAETKQPFPGHVFGALQLPAELAPGTYHIGLAWNPKQDLRWQATKDIAPLLVRAPGSIKIDLVDPGKFVAPALAPPRFAVSRLIQFSGFRDWQEVSASTDRLFENASRLPPNGALDPEIKRISAASSDPKERARLALELVQNSIRYVFTGMDGGNYRPATTAQTWERRFGDCKGVTAMLLALLRELQVPAEAVMVNVGGDDDIPDRLPSPASFNHVLVRSRIAGETFWLDGTRTGEGRMLSDADVGYRWVLPVSAKGSALEQRPYRIPARPSEFTYLDIDASAGMDQKAQVRMTQIFSGDVALGGYLALKSLSKASAEASLKQRYGGWIDPETAQWKYDNQTGSLMITVVGPAELDWDKDTSTDKPGVTTATYYLPAGGFNPPFRRERPSGQDKTLPYANRAGSFECNITRVKLPAIKGQHWDMSVKPMQRTVGGVAYYRQGTLDRNVVSLMRSTRTLQPELTPAEGEAVNRLIPSFDNKKSWVETEVGEQVPAGTDKPEHPDLATVDWLRDTSLCLPRTMP